MATNRLSKRRKSVLTVVCVCVSMIGSTLLCSSPTFSFFLLQYRFHQRFLNRHSSPLPSGAPSLLCSSSSKFCPIFTPDRIHFRLSSDDRQAASLTSWVKFKPILIHRTFFSVCIRINLATDKESPFVGWTTTKNEIKSRADDESAEWWRAPAQNGKRTKRTQTTDGQTDKTF